MQQYNNKKIERKWQRMWDAQNVYQAKDGGKKKFYALIEFPYPSGDGLHVGHPRPYIGMDIVARKRRMEGYNVLYPIGWDAFGLPTENYAIKTGIHPAVVTKRNTKNFKRQIQSLGISFDWSREINTTDPKYYKWTQWLFLQFLKHGLAYKKKMPINWCLSCKIGLANEEVVDGRCERCGSPTEKRDKEQWMLAITKYADRLDKDLDLVDYLPRIKMQQRNWIGRSEGAVISFKLKVASSKIPTTNYQLPTTVEVFTTRADTLFGATYLVLAPEHAFVREQIRNPKSEILNKLEIQNYANEARNMTEMERTAEGKEKTGVELKGIKAVNPANGEEIPVWIADYVLAEYGTGAIMAVPAHDERDFAFAKKFNLPIRHVVEPLFTQTTDPGKVIPGLPFVHRDAIIAIVKHWSEEKYLVLKWKEVAWVTFLTGGVEEGQTPEEAAKAEIREEVGYVHPVLVKNLGVIHSTFYHVPKKLNRFSHSHTLLFKLADGERLPVSPEEEAKHEPLWLPLRELRSSLTADSHHYALTLLEAENECSFVGEGVLVNSGQFSGLHSKDAKKKITELVEGEIVTTYKLRDWVFSRQRYWGEPIPVVFCEKCGIVPVPEKDLPVKLPPVKDYKPTDTGESPLAAVASWVNTACPECKGPARRETDTMPNWAGSSWYYLAYAMHHKLFPPSKVKGKWSKVQLDAWLPVDWYNGGMEHTTLHLLYSRFWHKFLYDIKRVPTPEPYAKRTSHGLILAEGGEKMSKSKGNVISPDDIVRRFGADTLRVYEMFMGPFEQAISWSTDSLVGARRFLEKVWRLRDKLQISSSKSHTPSHRQNPDIETLLHQTIRKVTEDIEAMRFNTAVSALMILVHALEKEERVKRSDFETLLKLLTPFAPHLSEELWAQLGHKKSVTHESWPQHDARLAESATVSIVVQVNGKVRGTFSTARGEPREALERRALALPEIGKWIADKRPAKLIVVPDRLVNIVV